MTTIEMRGAGKAPTGLGGSLRLLAAAVGATDLARRLELTDVRRRAYRRVRAELATYTDRELLSDLRISGAQIDELAAEEADLQVEAYVRRHPEYRTAWAGRHHAAGIGYARG